MQHNSSLRLVGRSVFNLNLRITAHHIYFKKKILILNNHLFTVRPRVWVERKHCQIVDIERPGLIINLNWWPVCVSAGPAWWPLCVSVGPAWWPLCVSVALTWWPLCESVALTWWPLCMSVALTWWPLCVTVVLTWWPLFVSVALTWWPLCVSCFIKYVNQYQPS